ncbi:MAG: alcohol dehydrogenase catalytic domain-containing protein [Solirubrobacterales bacterium]|nr:alcohol dehydrogenase catalytic domain-containing protein [Solirubrobacterales bacterium]
MTQGVGAMAVVDRPEPVDPGRGQVVVAPEAVGICGSDYHFFAGELSEAAGGSQFPRVQGHEVGASVVAVGPGCRGGLEVGQRVALLPLHACGRCYPCSVGRPNACDNFELIGIHVDGGLQQQLALPEEQVFPIGVSDPAVAALAEPVSIAVRAVNRARVERGERVVVLGAGPIGQCICLVARERGASVLVIDLQESRLGLSRSMGAETLVWTGVVDVVDAARRWAGPAGPPVAIDATGAPAAVRAMVDMVASAGRAVQVGMSGEEVTFRLGSLTEKELDLLGVSCCNGPEFGEAVAVVERNAELLSRLVSHRFALERAPEALRFAMDNPTEVMKVIIGGR